MKKRSWKKKEKEEKIKCMKDFKNKKKELKKKITAFFRSARILRRVPKTWGDLLSLKFSWKL